MRKGKIFHFFFPFWRRKLCFNSLKYGDTRYEGGMLYRPTHPSMALQLHAIKVRKAWPSFFYDSLDTPTMRTQEGSVDLPIHVFEGFETSFIEGAGNVIQWFLVTIEHPLEWNGDRPFLSSTNLILLAPTYHTMQGPMKGSTSFSILCSYVF